MQLSLQAVPAAVRKHYHKHKHTIRRGLIYSAFVLFFCDLLAAFWSPFDKVWSHAAHIAVASAAFMAFLAENFIQEEGEHHDAS